MTAFGQPMLNFGLFRLAFWQFTLVCGQIKLNCGQNELDRGDKIHDDLRVTAWGRLLRKYWIDEIPMLLNYLKRDFKLVGVRPISAQKLSSTPPNSENCAAKSNPDSSRPTTPICSIPSKQCRNPRPGTCSGIKKRHFAQIFFILSKQFTIF